jgi:L-lactate permease
VTDSVGGIYPRLLAPSVGALGAFIASSGHTVSSMMFSQFQFGVANSLGISSALIVASAKAISAAASGMVAIHNVVAASAIPSACWVVKAASCAVDPGLPGHYVLFTDLIVFCGLRAGH